MKLIAKLFVITAVLALFISASPASAYETYYHKGTTYTSTYKDWTGTKYGSSSVLVMSVSTNFAVPSGKERVRAYTRCDVINGIYNSYYCGIDEVSLRMSASTSSGAEISVPALVREYEVLPKPSTPINLADYVWPISNVYTEGAVRLVNAMANSNLIEVTHSSTSSNSAFRVTFNAPEKSLVDVPNTVAYQNIEGYYSGYRKGVSALFPFQYNTNGGGVEYLTVTGTAVYDLRVSSGDPYQPPLILEVSTGTARITHSIGI